jgi:hypothetical protein
MSDTLNFCIEQINTMLSRSKTKVIFPVITFGLVKKYTKDNQEIFSDIDIKRNYEESVNFLKIFLGHSLHIGGKYYDAYPSRNLPKYGVLKVIDNKSYRLTDQFKKSSSDLVEIIPNLIKEFITTKMGSIPSLDNSSERFTLSANKDNFLEFLSHQININPANFEIFSFAILKIHLEKFACKLYRDTRTSAHDKGVDLSTNFGVVYLIKKLKLLSQNSADDILKELQSNFSEDRIKDGNVVLVIDDIFNDIKSFLINMKIQSISRDDILKLASLLEVKDRMSVLKIVYEEFSRDYKSDI